MACFCALKLIVFNLFCSSCVDETKLCMGTPLCENKNDLKLCRNATSWNLANADWKPVVFSSTCPLTPQNNKITSYGQFIKVDQMGDKNQFNCYDRADENPYNMKMFDTNGTWLQLVKKTCSIDDIIMPFSAHFRRCLGKKPAQCVGADCKFDIFIKFNPLI